MPHLIALICMPHHFCLFKNDQSLALCTALIMFALTQDKLVMSIEKETFDLIISITNMKSSNNTAAVSTQKTKKQRGRPAAPKENKNSAISESENCDDSELYHKLFKPCKQLTEKIANLGK